MRQKQPRRRHETEGGGLGPDPMRAVLVGTSQATRDLENTLARLAKFSANVLLLGESGTGKELIARALHASGPRRRKLFVPVSCATLAPHLLENELFGHERGAFPGALERKKGLFELADGGTLFFDEIAELDLSTQAKLLRAIERSEFRRVGGTRKLRVDVSLVAATNRDLGAAIAAGRFREDLYYRLRVVTIVAAPLRERREDIPALVDAFVADFNDRNEGKIRGVAPAAVRLLMEQPWPGNVRELKNVVENAAMWSDGDMLELAAISRALTTARPQPPPPPLSAVAAPADELRFRVGARLDDVERALIIATVARARSRKDAAVQLGIGERTLYTKLRSYGM